MKKSLYFLPLLMLTGCASTILSRNDQDVPLSTLESLHELRSELAQLTHLIHGQSVDIQLLEEKVSNLSLKKRELLSENLEAVQQKVDQIESVLASMRMNVEQTKKQHQHVFDTQLQRLVSLENKVTQHDNSLHVIKDIKNMMTQLKTSPPQSSQSYRVESGDTLEGICRRYGLKINELKSLNHLETDQIQVGQVLKIPL
jgi:LysM repeat protein